MAKTKARWVIKDSQSLEGNLNEELQVKLNPTGFISKDNDGIKLYPGNTDGDFLVWSSELSQWVPAQTGVSVTDRYVQATKPLNPNDGDEWLHTGQNITYFYRTSLNKWLSQSRAIYQFAWNSNAKNVYLSPAARISDSGSCHYFNREFTIVSVNGYVTSSPYTNATFSIQNNHTITQTLTWIANSNSYSDYNTNYTFTGETLLQMYWGGIQVTNPIINLEIAWSII